MQYSLWYGNFYIHHAVSQVFTGVTSIILIGENGWYDTANVFNTIYLISISLQYYVVMVFDNGIYNYSKLACQVPLVSLYIAALSLKWQSWQWYKKRYKYHTRRQGDIDTIIQTRRNAMLFLNVSKRSCFHHSSLQAIKI
jgi:hypothetical protein